ncbi:FERM domain-containing protein 8-like [Branchiostoma floridae]|uniref:FERM domain-containing protein 8 n=1 Tax=Branchiostoma floridae TaxID=7739 RepID=A0A9J7LKM5_BRAFL|nr:FERM domain-containing protein 8-like [Branchiostoma floridae]XP_035684297.1 FERM domain-containing protein 8-like [Branchiostoma floridae]XP_035684308.1 FERM domain-containing protein 8-like [Branchiostoma floridae]XP_035684319.1 FERM domain-containing protein 8-like [Branchiostoma floridae]XP_035684327.1 FERM domain-containing protein 8-like [Branchiostoma floridae]
MANQNLENQPLTEDNGNEVPLPTRRERIPLQRLHIEQRQSDSSYATSDLGRQSSISPTSRNLELCVYSMDKCGLQFCLDNGKHTTAGELSKLVQGNLDLPQQASEVFCLWLTSPLLQLQLKPHHKPYKLCKQWYQLLTKFTGAKQEDIEKEEPILCYQRNCFLSVKEEKRITDTAILHRLFDEAKYNILEGRYPVPENDVYYFGALLSFIEHGKFDPNIHQPGFFKDKISDFLPGHMCKNRWSFPGRSPRAMNEQKLLERYQHVSEATHITDHKVEFLKKCWELPYYGSVFFKGQIERPCNSMIMREMPDRPVHVAVNREMVHIVDLEKKAILLGLAYDELSWEYTEPSVDRPNGFPCLWLEFDAEEDSKKVNKLLQIFSKQAVMMDAMIDVCVEDLNRRDINTSGALPSQLMSRQVSVKPSLTNRFDRLSLSTFNDEGERISSSAAVKRQFSLSNPFRRPSKYHHPSRDMPHIVRH